VLALPLFLAAALGLWVMTIGYAVRWRVLRRLDDVRRLLPSDSAITGLVHGGSSEAGRLVAFTADGWVWLIGRRPGYVPTRVLGRKPVSEWCPGAMARMEPAGRDRRRTGERAAGRVQGSAPLTVAPRRLAAVPLDGEYEPSAWDWVREQVDEYESSGGTKGLTLGGKPVVVVTMRGRRSGKIRKAAVMRVEHDGAYAAVASKGGAPEHPGWYLNLLENPDVTVQDGPDVHEMRARVADGDEKAAWWARAVEVWPAYDEYQQKTDRPIPVVLLEPR
jgi:F420H(2)-dependent quinone reductase